ncbi:MAG: glycosyltransferase, partial [Nanoarchaeota archaeon]|nr:glycosyltransferase [Nanoarchaeota archaeon]
MTISIILPSFNYSWCIGQAIESVVNQSYQDWELIIVDDCSSDDSIDVIKRYIDNKPKKIRLLSNPKNIGLAKTYERGVNHSVGEYIAFIESDDIWSQDKLKTQIATMERNPSVVLSYTDIELFGTKNDYFMKRAAEIERYKISFKIAEGP